MGKAKLIFLFISILYYNLSLSQKTVSDIVFWYKVDFNIVRDSSNFKPYYKIVKVYPELLSGTRQDYLKFQKANMQNGRIAIGPFKEKESVVFSLHYYANSNIDFVIQNENILGDYYWYSVSVSKIIKNNGLDFTRISNGVAYGSINEFKEVLYEAVENLNLIIGPFPNQADAEYAQSTNELLIPKHLRQQNPNVFVYKPKKMAKYVNFETLYWFRLKLDSKIDSTKKRPIYYIVDVKPEIIWGTSKKYVKYQKEQMKNGFVCIGPFDDIQLAKNATDYYKNYREIEYTGQTFRDTTGYSEYFFYVSQIRTTKRNGSKEFVRCPARVSDGSTLLEFRQSLFEGLEICHFMIGPFLTRVNAEESKRLNRLLESGN